jgi:hypothetical protein
MKPITITLNVNVSDAESAAGVACVATTGVVERHACQGLNTCAGKGAGGTGTKAGDGSCATVPHHGCVGGNQCKTEGACGKDPYDPVMNNCRTLGGCQVPISTQQTFDSNAPSGLDRSVWKQARKNLATRLSVPVTDLGCPPDLPSALRQSTDPTVKAVPPLPAETC